MDFGFLGVRGVSPRTSVGNPALNAQSALGAISDELNKSQAVILPELFLSSATCGDLFRQDILLGECENALFTLAENTARSAALIAVGTPLRVGNRLLNCMAVIQQGKILGFIPKENLTSAEKRWFSSAVHGDTVTIRGEKYDVENKLFKLGNNAVVGITFGSSLRSPRGISDLALSGANVILCGDCKKADFNSPDDTKDLIKNQSKSSLCAVAYANANVGESTTDGVYDGFCMTCENGVLFDSSDCFDKEESSAYICADCESLNSLRRQSECFAESEIKSFVTAEFTPLEPQEVNRTVCPHPFVLQHGAENINDYPDVNRRCEKILKIQSTALARRLKHTHSERVVLGISGGLDSTLALLAAAKATDLMGLPRKNIICITLPGFGTTGQTYQNALELIRSVGAEEREIDIKPSCIQHMRDIGHDMNIHDVTYENTQARERTQILMDVANKERGLLIGTGDLSELALGWCTYNGDHMSMYGVNGDITKTLIRKIVDYYCGITDERTSAVLRKILDTPVSPELLPPDENGEIAQMTEEKLGPYEVHDFYLYYLLRFGTRPAKLLFLAQKAFPQYGKDELTAWLKTFLRRFWGSQFKRSCSPDGPSIDDLNLSPRGGLSMPSDAVASLWLGEADNL